MGIAITDPTADRAITFPDETGTVVLTGQTGNVDSTMIADGTIVSSDLASSIGISTTGNIATTSSGTITSAGTLTANGDVTLGDDTSDRITFTGVVQGQNAIRFEGASADANELTISVTDPTADRTVTFPDATGTVVLTGQTGNVDSTMITDGTVAGADLASNIGISTTGNIATTSSGTITSAGLLTASAGLSVTGDLTMTREKYTATALSPGGAVGADMSTSNNLLTFADDASTSATTLLFSNCDANLKLIIVRNNDADDVSITSCADGGTLAIAQDRMKVVACDNTGVYCYLGG